MRDLQWYIRKLARALVHFGPARGGNIAITFAIALIPMLAFVGAAVDYSRANAMKASLQAALDTAALMASKNAATLTNTQLQAAVQSYFDALFTRPEASNAKVTVSFSTSGGSNVVVNGSIDMDTEFMGMFGFKTINVVGTSTVKWGSARLRVALVLDNTGSMSADGKMGAMQTATKNLLTQLQNAASVNGDVYVSIVPFVKDVNLDTANWNSNWIYWDDAAKTDTKSWDANNGNCSIGSYSPRNTCLAQSSCSLSSYTTQSTCTAAGTCSISSYTTSSTCTAAGTCSISGSGHNTQSTCTTGICSISGYTTSSTCTAAHVCSNAAETTQSTCTGTKACSKSQYTSKNPCQNNGGTWGFGTWTAGVWTPPGTWTVGTWTPGIWTAATWTPKPHNTWTGCVVDRGNPGGPNSNNYDTNAVAPDPAIPASLYAAEQYGSCPQAVMALNYNWSGMNLLVDSMSPAGNTNQAIGLQLGWMSLVGGGPFTVPALETGYTYSNIIILLSDGLNTQDRWYSTQSSIDARQKLTCANIKTAGITLYTIQVNTGGDPTSTLLQNCASSADKFYLLTSATQIITTFDAIGNKLTQLRVAK